MKFDTKMFAAAASAALVMTSASAFAAGADLSASPATYDGVFASEITIDGTNGTTLTNDSTAATALGVLDVTAHAGFVISDGVTHYVRFELSNGATFDGAPDLAVTDSGGAGGATETLTAGGDGESYAIFSVTPANTQTVAVDGDVILYTANYKVLDQQAVTISYAMYETAGDAVNENNALASDSGTLLSFTSGLEIAGASATTYQIDVTAESKTFTTGSAASASTVIGDVDVAVVTGNQFQTDGATDLTLANAIAAGTQLIVTGDFTFCANADGTYTGAALNRVFIDNDGTGFDVDTACDTLTATTATFNLDDAAVADAAALCITAEGSNVIPEGSYTALYDVTAEANYTVADVNMTLGTLTKNGATDTVNFLLKPTSAFTNLVRITNTGTVAGDVFLTLISDAGSSVTFNLDALAAYSTSTLASGASTAYISVADLYAAAQAADATFDNAEGQLRLNVSSTCTEIIVNAFAMSKDNNVFTVIDSVDNAAN